MTETKEINFDELRASADEASGLMKVMANSDRLILLCQLSQGEKSVGELESILDIRQPTLSQQLAVLREAELVTTRREGKNIFYRISSQSAMAVMQVLHEQICNVNKGSKMSPLITKQSQDFGTAPQISVDDVSEIARLGYKSIINNRPDFEDGDSQPTSDQIKAAAESLGLSYFHIPVVPNSLKTSQIVAFKAWYASANKPIFGFCKTGNRANSIWKSAEIQSGN